MTKPIMLELSLVDHPGFVFDVGEVPAVPAVGAFVSHDIELVTCGYVASTRWSIGIDRIVVRVWLQKDPP